jgi:enterochelin esterase-like enzyme
MTADERTPHRAAARPRLLVSIGLSSLSACLALMTSGSSGCSQSSPATGTTGPGESGAGAQASDGSTARPPEEAGGAVGLPPQEAGGAARLPPQGADAGAAGTDGSSGGGPPDGGDVHAPAPLDAGQEASRLDAATGAVVLSPVADGKQVINGPYNPPAEATRKPGVPQAVLDHFVYDTSTVFPNTSRNVDIFIPAQYAPGTPVPFMVIQDGDEQLQSFHTDVVMENLIFQKRLPVMAAIFVNRPDNGPIRSLEYDCLGDDYSRFILTEILPLAKSRHPDLDLTADPDGRGSLGKSSGGPAAFTLGWRHPESFRRILTLNGSFVNLCKSGPGAGTYPNLVSTTDPAKPLRVYLFSGTGDLAGFAAGNQAMADALAAKGYAWRYVFGNGVTHANNFAASMMTEALLWTWAGYPIP